MVEIRRIQHSMDRYGRRFLDRVYTRSEQAYCLRKRNSGESFAARFAAKEAGAKALGTGISYGVSWLEIEVVREPSGRPTPQVPRTRRRDRRPDGICACGAFHHTYGRTWRRPAWCWKIANRQLMSPTPSSGILKASTASIQQEELRAKPQRDSVVATESGSACSGGYGRPDRADLSDVRIERWAFCHASWFFAATSKMPRGSRMAPRSLWKA